ncbi:ATP-binding protein [bacterium]|nr:ATP-binding protein [bacterium]
MKNYKKRVVDSLLLKKLKGKGAVLIEGTKWCGKTTTAEQAAASVLYMDEPKTMNQNLVMADTDPEYLLEGKNPRLIDEWQLAPKLWDTIRFSVDHKRQFGLYILTGSAVPLETDEIHHSGTGRFSWLKMRPMSLFESGESSGEVSLKELFSSHDAIVRGAADLSLKDIAFLICRGGWPMSLECESEIALQHAFDYFDAVVRSDISRADGVSKNPDRVIRLMRSFARNLGSQTSIKAICEDLKTNESSDFSEITVNSYINALKKIFVVEDMPAWNPNLRSKTAVRSSETRYFVDPSIAVAALGLGPDDLINDLNTLGLLFETLCVRDLRVFADALDGEVRHYRDKNGLECDAVIHLRNGSFGLIEIKLGGDTAIEHGAATLKKLASLIDTDKMKAPSFLMVLTAVGNYAYRRNDGVYIVPIGCLKD